MAKKSESGGTVTMTRQPTGDPFADAFARSDRQKTDAQVAFDKKRYELRAEFARIAWRKARNQSTLADAGRLVELADSEHLADMQINRAMFDRCVEVCQRWDMKRGLFATVGTLQEQRDAAHARVVQLTAELREAESAAGAAAGSLMVAHDADNDSRQISRVNPLLFDPVLNQARDGNELSVEAFVAAATR